MAVERSDIRFVKSATVTDTTSNGGKMSYNYIQNRVKYNLFPRVTRPERVAGIIRYRKEYIWNREASGETAFGLLTYIILPSLADDLFRIAEATQDDTQGDIDDDYDWYGAGNLNAGASAGASSINVNFEDDDIALKNGVLLAINSHFLMSENIDSAVKPFSQVYWNGSKWIAQNAPTEDAEDVYPYGTCIQVLGGGKGNIFSYNSAGNLEYHRIDDPTYTENMTPAPTGGVVAYTLVAANTPVLEESVSVEYCFSSVMHTATDDGEGHITGSHIVSGAVVYSTGNMNITFSTNPDPSTQIAVTYHENIVSWAGTVATVQLEDTLLNNFLSANTKVGMCLELGDLAPIVELISEAFGDPSGDFDESLVTGTNKGSIEETWTLQFTSVNAFTVTGAGVGVIGSGSKTVTYSPLNSGQGAAYFSIPATAWSGTTQAGDTVIFKTYPAAAPIWWKEIVPSSTNAFSNNVVMLEIYVE
jgi:hypothetical protein